MAALNGMETYVSRLASFSIAQPIKKRGSDAKGAKSVRWPHENPKAEQLATAGFFYKPSAVSADNVRCFLCSRDMDGWEEDDNPVIEHLKHSPGCGWAINMGIEQQVNDKLKDPSSEEMLDARRMTFGVNWPHEHKRGWACKTQKMIESGWYYCPTPESDDFVKCSYCDLGLDGWEPKDNPYDEHVRRSPDCPFLRFASTKHKVGRPRKNSRASKVSRISSVSISSAVSEGLSIVVLECNESEPQGLPTTESEEPVKPGKGAKKGSKAKKASTKSKKKTKTAKTEDSTMADSVTELETENFAVHDVKIQPRSGKSNKRNSDQMNEGNDHMPEEVQPRNRPAKRRATTTRSNALQLSARASVDRHEAEVEMTDAESMPPPPPPVSKKGVKKGGKKRASAPTRNASAGTRKASESMRNPSTTSTASVASLRAPPPDDDDIDAALEADLDRPFTDDEIEDEKSEVVYPRIEKTKVRRSEIEDLVYPRLKKVEIPQYAAEQHETQEKTQHGIGQKNEPELEPVVEPEEEPEAEPEVEPEVEPEPEAEIEPEPEPEIIPEEVPEAEPETEQHEVQEAEIGIEQIKVQQPDAQTPSRSRSSRVMPSTKKSTPAPKRRSPRALLTDETRNDSGSDKENDSSQIEAHADRWTPVDIGMLFAGSPAGEMENDDPLAAFGSMVIEGLNEPLPSPEKAMTIEQWIQHKAKQAEDRLRNQCERLVGKFESEGMRALRTLEGLTCVD